MDYISALVESLVEFYTVEQIRDFWKQTADAMMARTTVNLHFNNTAFEGQSGSAITLSTPQEQAAFIGACKQAIAQLEGSTAVPVSALGTGVDFSNRAVLA